MNKWYTIVGLIFVTIFCLTNCSNKETELLKLYQAQAEGVFRDFYLRVDENNETKRISEIIPFDWDFIFYAGYYSDGLKSVIKEVKVYDPSIKMDDYHIYDEYFEDAEEGLVFLNRKEKFILTVPLSSILGGISEASLKKEDACIKKSKKSNSQDKYLTLIRC